MDFDDDPMPPRTARFHHLLAVNTYQVSQSPGATAKHPAGPEFTTCEFVFGNGVGDVMSIVLEPGQEMLLLSKVVRALEAGGCEAARRVAEYLDATFEPSGPDQT